MMGGRIKTNQSKPQEVGYLTARVIELLKIEYPPQAIYIGRTNIKHIREKRPQIFHKYLQQIPEIISSPDYVGQNPRQEGFEYIKVYKENILVAVKSSGSGRLFVRSMYPITPDKLKKYLQSHNLCKF